MKQAYHREVFVNCGSSLLGARIPNAVPFPKLKLSEVKDRIAYSRAIQDLRKILERERAGEKKLRAALESLSVSGSQSLNAALAGALEERDRQMADLQRETDARLAEVEDIKKEANLREQEAEEKAEEIRAIKKEADHRLEELQVAISEAEQRQALLVRSNAAVETLDAALKTRNAEVESLREQLALLQAQQSPPSGDAHVLGLHAQIESLQMQLQVVTQAAEERLIALQSNVAAVHELRRQLEEREAVS